VEPERDAERELVHQINNLLGVIATQAAVARVEPGEASARRALDLIERAAADTEAVVRRCRARDHR
jgi:hypothetical protein